MVCLCNMHMEMEAASGCHIIPDSSYTWRNGKSEATIFKVKHMNNEEIEAGVNEKTSQKNSSISICQLPSEPYLCEELEHVTSGQISLDLNYASSQASSYEVKKINYMKQQTIKAIKRYPRSLSSSIWQQRSKSGSSVVGTKDLDYCQTNSRLDDTCENGLYQKTSYEANYALGKMNESGIDDKACQEVSVVFAHRLPSNSSFLHKATSEDTTLSTPSNGTERPYQESKRSSSEKKHTEHMATKASHGREVMLQVQKDFSQVPHKRQKREIDFLKKEHLDVKTLLSSGFLEGFTVKYMKDKVELHGRINGQGYLCSCSLCNNKEVLSALKFECHAGATSNNQNNHIFLRSGISLYALVKKLSNAPLDSRSELIEQYSHNPINKDVNDFQVPPSKTECSKAATSSINIRCKSHLLPVEEEIASSSFIDFDTNLELDKECRLSGLPTTCKKAIDSSSNDMHTSSHLHVEGIIIQSCSNASINSCELAKEDRLVGPPTKNRDSTSSSINGICNVPESQIEGNIITSSSTDVNGTSFEKERRFSEYVESTKATSSDRLVGPTTKNREATSSSINGICNVPESQMEGNIITSASTDVNGTSFEKEGRFSESHVASTKATFSSTKVICNARQPYMDENIMPSLSICISSGSLELAKEGSINQGSNISIQGSSIINKSSTTEIISERRKRPPSSLNTMESHVPFAREVSVAKGGTRKRTGDLHRILFTENVLQDGAKLFYMSNKKKILEGEKRENGILCGCCHQVVSPSKFEAHAGFDKKRQPYRGIYTSSGISLRDLIMSLSNHQNLASICVICGGQGELVSCSGCARAYHADCMGLSTIEADSERHCFSCKDKLPSGITSRLRPTVATKPIKLGLERVIEHPKDVSCTVCEDDTFEIGKELVSKSFIFCGQCEKLYHVGCLKDTQICDLKERQLPWFSWLCSVECKDVREDLQRMVAASPHDIHALSLNMLKRKAEASVSRNKDGAELKWQLLSGNHKTSYDTESLFSMATIIFQEAFGPIHEKGQDLIPAMVKGQDFGKQHYGGMYCVVITTGSGVASAGLVRIFSQDVAELPLVATSKACQGKGYFQALLSIVEQMLIRLKVKSLVLPADENTQPIWINKFGFVKMTKERVKLYAEKHWIVMFKDKPMLEKELTQSRSLLGAWKIV